MHMLYMCRGIELLMIMGAVDVDLPGAPPFDGGVTVTRRLSRSRSRHPFFYLHLFCEAVGYSFSLQQLGN